MKNIKIASFLGFVCAWLASTSLHAAPPVTSGLAAWFQADSLVGLTKNQPVFTWTDSSGNGNTAVGNTYGNTYFGEDPTFVTNAVGGKSAVHFNALFGEGSGDHL